MTNIEAMKQALEALEKLEYSSIEGWCKRYPTEEEANIASTNLRTAIQEIEKAEPEDEVYLVHPDLGTVAGKPAMKYYTHPAPLTVHENLDEIAENIANDLTHNGWDGTHSYAAELGRRLIAKLQEQGK